MMLLSILTGTSFAQVFTPGETYYGTNNYVQYMPGTLPLIFGAPHGGDMEPSHIPNRQSGPGVWLIPDFRSRELAIAIREAFFEQLGAYPHFIIANIHRNKVDLNRWIDVAAQGNPDAEQTWYEYIGFVNQARTTVVDDYGKGLLIDVHRHGHSVQRLELGYLVTMDQLRLSDQDLNSSVLPDSSSVFSLLSSSGLSISELIRGPNSLGTRFEAAGIPTVPSSGQPAPLAGEEIFTGAGATWFFGSRNGLSTIDAIQFESHYDGVLENDQMIEDFAHLIVQVLTDYVRDFYGFDLVSTAVEDEITPPAATSLSVFPNPVSASGAVTVSANVAPGSRIDVYDILGRRVDSIRADRSNGSASPITWQPDALAPGLYFVVLTGASSAETASVLVTR